MPEGPAQLTILQLTHQGEGAGSTQSIFSLSRELAHRGHRVLVGCPAGTLLARSVAATPSLEHVALDFSHFRNVANTIAGVIADKRVNVANSHATGDRRALTFDLGRVEAAPSAADLRLAQSALGDSGRPVVAVVARRKDQQILLRALPALERPVTVAFVGIRADAELGAAQAAVPDRHRIVFVPFTEPPRALAFYRFATLAALPSRIEGLSQALLEAMALGVPVIASAAGGNAELVRPGETGLLVPPLDPAAWTRALERMLGDDAFRARVARAGQTLVRGEFTMGRTADRTEVVYREAIASR
ncbi:MAG: hypothetical protein DMD59_08785 [Gemmatimonadetes bacterium]|nr:MAG: hypothetical protein DMD59_08785 [Gemmatimonadota bacterium]